MSDFDRLLQYLQHLNVAIRHPIDSKDLDHLWNERARVREAIESITAPRW